MRDHLRYPTVHFVDEGFSAVELILLKSMAFLCRKEGSRVSYVSSFTVRQEASAFLSSMKWKVQV